MQREDNTGVFGDIVLTSLLYRPHVLAGETMLRHGTSSIGGRSKDGKDQRDSPSNGFRAVELGEGTQEKILSAVRTFVGNDRGPEFMHGKGCPRSAVGDGKNVAVVHCAKVIQRALLPVGVRVVTLAFTE